MPRLRPFVLIALGAVGALLVGCEHAADVEADATRGDCAANLRVADETYRPVNGLLRPRAGSAVGRGTFLDCDGSPIPAYGSPTGYRIPGVDPQRAIVVTTGDGASTYLNTRFAYADRPALLKETGHYLRCSGPARFTSSWGYVDVEDMPSMEDYGSAHVPYRVSVTTSRGTGVGLDRWSEVTLQLRITADTDPVPTVRFLRQALRDRRPVQVTARCEDGEYVATTLRIAAR